MRSDAKPTWRHFELAMLRGERIVEPAVLRERKERKNSPPDEEDVAQSPVSAGDQTSSRARRARKTGA